MSEFTSESKGAVFLDRRIIETEWFTGCSINTVYLMLFLLITANYEPRVWRGIKVGRGEVITSVGNQEHPGRLMTETQLPYSTLARSLQKLEEIGEIKVTKKTGLRGYTRITITHYDLYTAADKKVNKKADKKVDSKAEHNKEVEEVQEEDNSTVKIDWGDD